MSPIPIPRGVRNNNPGNLEYDPAVKWQGLVGLEPPPPDGSRARFCAFKTPQFGIRALARTLLTYQHEHQLDTVRKIIGRWAPPGENDTEAYVADVARRVGVGADQAIDVDQAAIMKPLVCAIVWHENKGYAYPDAVVDEGLHMAGVSDAPAPPLHKSPAFRAQVATGAALAASAATDYAPKVKAAADSLSEYTGIAAFAHVHTALLAAAGALTVAGIAAAAIKWKLST